MSFSNDFRNCERLTTSGDIFLIHVMYRVCIGNFRVSLISDNVDMHLEYFKEKLYSQSTLADSIKLSTWNLNGWTLSNSSLRSSIIKVTESQVLCVNETHLTGNLSIEIQGFTWICHNRTKIHRKSKKGSGGVGIFVSNSLLVSYKYDIIDKSQDGIICVRFTHIPLCIGSLFLLVTCPLNPPFVFL